MVIRPFGINELHPLGFQEPHHLGSTRDKGIAALQRHVCCRHTSDGLHIGARLLS